MKARNPISGNLENVYVKALDGTPIGSIVPFPSNDVSKVPVGYMICDGSAISRTTYSDLYSVIGTTFGTGDGSTTFNLPNLKGRTIVGYDSTDTDFDTIGKTGGEKKHTLTIDEMPSHSHDVQMHAGGSQGLLGLMGIINGTSSATLVGGSQFGIISKGSSQAHNNLQPYIVMSYIIRVTRATPLQAQVIDSYNTSTTDGYSCNYINGIAGEVIYENSLGTDLDLVCSSAISNYDYLQFDYEHQSSHSSVIAPIINDKVQIRSIGIPSNNNTMQFMVQKYTINDKTLELDIEGMVNISGQAVSYQSFTFGNQATIRVKRIIGIKK